MVEPKPGLMRSREHAWLAGVCGGFAEWLGWNPDVVRIVFVVVSAMSAAFPGIRARLTVLLDETLPSLEDQAEAAGAPWTPGRGVPGWRR